MRIWITLAITLLAVATTIFAQITTNPLPAPVEKRGLMVEIRDVGRLPQTRGMFPADQDVNPAGWARVSFVRDLPDGRRFAKSLTGRNLQKVRHGRIGNLGHILRGGLLLCERRSDTQHESNGKSGHETKLHMAPPMFLLGTEIAESIPDAGNAG